MNAATDPPSQPLSYRVGEVKGQCPAGLEDFLGVASFTVIHGNLTERVFGSGEQIAGAVRFRQQDLGGNGREVRT